MFDVGDSGTMPQTYQLRLYVTGVHALECRAASPDEARRIAEALWWRGERQDFRIDDVPSAGPAVVHMLPPP